MAGRPSDPSPPGQAILRQLLIGGSVEAIVSPRRRKARPVPVALWSTDYATTMFDTGAADSPMASAPRRARSKAECVSRRSLAAALLQRSGRTRGGRRAGRSEILAAFDRLDGARLVSYDRGGLARAAEALAWSFPSHKAATIAGIIRTAYAARRDAGEGEPASRQPTR